MFKKIQIDTVATTFKLTRLLLAVTIWSCHAWVAPAFRLCHGLAAAASGLRGPRKDRIKIAAVSLQAKAFRNLSLQGVKRLRGQALANPEIPHLALNKLSNPMKNEIATPPGLAMTCQENDRVRIHPSKFFQLRSRATRIASIPRIWRQGIKQPMGQGVTPNPELRIPNSKGFTLIEVIAVLIIIGILAAIVLPRIDFGATSSRASVDGAAYMIASDIRYAQEFAMANRVSKSVIFTNGSSTYTFNPMSAGMDPSGQLQSIGATVGTTATFTFNSLGEPTSGGGSTVTVSSGGQSRTITVTQYTGKVSIS